MSPSSKVRKFSCRVLGFRYIFLIFISRQNKVICAQRAPKKSQGLSHFDSNFWRYAGLVAGIHFRGQDLAFFPPCPIFSTTNVYICIENAAHIGGFSSVFTSCGLLLLKEECRISSFCSCLLVLANVR